MAVEVVDEDEEPTLEKDYTSEKLGSRTRDDTVKQYVKERAMTWQAFAVNRKNRSFSSHFP
jgi:hypothetical protein